MLSGSLALPNRAASRVFPEFWEAILVSVRRVQTTAFHFVTLFRTTCRLVWHLLKRLTLAFLWRNAPTA